MLYLYQIENLVNGKKYIGITNDPDKRKWQHFAGYGSKLVFRAIKKYGADNLEFSTLRSGEDDFIKWLEIEKIKDWKTKIPNGYNLTDGGEGAQGCIPTEACRQQKSLQMKTFYDSEKGIIARQKTSERFKNVPFTAEHRVKIKAGLRGFYDSPKAIKVRQATIKRNKERTLSQQSRAKIANSLKGRKDSPEACRNKSLASRGSKNPAARRVLADGVEYDCIKDAAIALKRSPHTLRTNFARWSKTNKFPAGFKYL